MSLKRKQIKLNSDESREIKEYMQKLDKNIKNNKILYQKLKQKVNNK